MSGRHSRIYGASPFIETTRGYGVRVIRPLLQAYFDAAGL
jgi:hypothetical protein